MSSQPTILPSPLRPLLAPGIVLTHFDVQSEAPQRQLLAWRERMGSVFDVLPSLAKIDLPFHGWVSRYSVGELSFVNIYSDAVRVERSLARISTNRACDCFYFSVCIEGDSHAMEGRHASRTAPARTKILVLDMDQPVRMQAHRHHMSGFFVPRAVVEAILPEADCLHGRALDDTTPLARLLIAHAATLNRTIGSMSAEEADSALRTAIELLVAAFGKQARLSGSARGAVRAAMFGQVRRYVEANLHDSDLSAEKILRALQLPRSTLYRLFEQEGGINTYIGNRRLLAAARDIVRFPQLAVKDIAYGLGFGSASAFSRAFRREYDMTPQDLRAHLEMPSAQNRRSS